MQYALVLSSLAAAVFAQANGSPNGGVNVQVVVDIFYYDESSYGYGSYYSQEGVSVVAADESATTLAIGYEDVTYTDRYDDEGTTTTSYYTLTQGPGFYQAINSDEFYTTTVSCSIDGTTEAVCQSIYSYSSDDSSFVRMSETTMSEEEIYFYPVTVTAGIEKILAVETGLANLANLPTTGSLAASESQPTSASRPTGSLVTSASGAANTNPAAAPTPAPTNAASSSIIRGGAVAGVAAVAAVVLAL